MKILIVDDEYDKVGEIVSVAREISKDIEFEHATTAVEARERICNVEYDFLIVDLNLPSVVGDAPSENGGVDFVRMMFHDSRSKIPGAIEFLTGKEDGLEASSQLVDSVGGRLTRYGYGANEWKKIMRGRLEMALKRRARARPKIDVVVVAALRGVELEAVLALPYSWSSVAYPEESVTHYFGSVESDGRVISVVAAAAMRKGMASSAALASRMVAIFRPSVVVMPGICAGMADKTNFGDVVVADPAWDWGSGKRVSDEDGRRFLLSPHQAALHPLLRRVAQDLATDQDTTRRILQGWPDGLPEGKLAVHIGPFASGASVLADGETIDDIKRHQNRDVVAVDMEAYAVMDAVSYSAGSFESRAIAIKSVCDFADGSKGDKWQKYAAFTSAAFMDQMLRDENFKQLIR
jgi:nucleoside phosphorylase